MALQLESRPTHTQVVILQRPLSTLFRTRPLERLIGWLKDAMKWIENRIEGSVFDSDSYKPTSNYLIHLVQGVVALLAGLFLLTLLLCWWLLILPLYLLSFLTETLPSHISKGLHTSDLTLGFHVMTLSVRGRGREENGRLRWFDRELPWLAAGSQKLSWKIQRIDVDTSNLKYRDVETTLEIIHDRDAADPLWGIRSRHTLRMQSPEGPVLSFPNLWLNRLEVHELESKLKGAITEARHRYGRGESHVPAALSAMTKKLEVKPPER